MAARIPTIRTTMSISIRVKPASPIPCNIFNFLMPSSFFSWFVHPLLVIVNRLREYAMYMPDFPPAKMIRERLDFQGLPDKAGEAAARPPHAQATRFGGKQQFLEIGWQRTRGVLRACFPPGCIPYSHAK